MDLVDGGGGGPSGGLLGGGMVVWLSFPRGSTLMEGCIVGAPFPQKLLSQNDYQWYE